MEVTTADSNCQVTWWPVGELWLVAVDPRTWGSVAGYHTVLCRSTLSNRHIHPPPIWGGGGLNKKLGRIACIIHWHSQGGRHCRITWCHSHAADYPDYFFVCPVVNSRRALLLCSCTCTSTGKVQHFHFSSAHFTLQRTGVIINSHALPFSEETSFPCQSMLSQLVPFVCVCVFPVLVTWSARRSERQSVAATWPVPPWSALPTTSAQLLVCVPSTR